MPEPALIPPVPQRLPERVSCRRCGRPLHDPVSRMLRLGRECRGPEDAARVVAGEQDTLPGLSAGGPVASPGPDPAPDVPPRTAPAGPGTAPAEGTAP
ncbi:DUF6011 domain-containing protein [Kitasatospora sp. NBC_01539]|uniref:DUF6011 domain-containing protein n=1 Tax=Kitasatospora sp. NBC_01539 TaxID=2903577 RepID=UPI0038600DEE